MEKEALGENGVGLAARLAKKPWHKNGLGNLVRPLAKIVTVVGGIGVVAERAGVYL